MEGTAYRSEWWSVELPLGWIGYRGEECSTFQTQPPLGALQISAARKSDGPITDGDLQEFGAARVGPETELQESGFGAFTGFTARYRKDGLRWQEWWFRSGHLLVYVTYNVRQEDEPIEQAAISSILESLAPVA